MVAPSSGSGPTEVTSALGIDRSWLYARVGAEKGGPAFFFPAHWAPNDLLIYKARQFPQAYQGGAFIAFHGSWNRAPGPQGGYSVVFQPLSNGRPAGHFVVFADGFAGPYKEPGRALARPSGLAVGPDGSDRDVAAASEFVPPGRLDR